ncbi:hypothetical protein F9B85_08675 [Heliorestis acidaminivorans]|uniref:Uncharacterized protein n=1 Tax=Heliorestis acidaminivorans TaxID=553427 RepID=A0A6I0F0W1_9FIRM|nr:hypothetical protein [Heliorestis acidaminivorans]KAB2952714.1 hypothetical protein F9B85_08675 [Heliorestis acidaminivorans]
MRRFWTSILAAFLFFLIPGSWGWTIEDKPFIFHEEEKQSTLLQKQDLTMTKDLQKSLDLHEQLWNFEIAFSEPNIRKIYTEPLLTEVLLLLAYPADFYETVEYHNLQLIYNLNGKAIVIGEGQSTYLHGTKGLITEKIASRFLLFQTEQGWRIYDIEDLGKGLISQL